MKPNNNLEDAIAALQAAGAEGIWIIRGIEAASLEYVPDGSGSQTLTPAPCEMVILVRFSPGDGGEPGVEYR